MDSVNQHPGAFVLEIADLGKDVLSTFTQFLLSRKVVDHRLENLLATISITTSLLVAIGSNINKYEDVYPVEDTITRPICEICKADFSQLIAMCHIAKEKGGWITESPLGGQPTATEVDPWFVFNLTLGQGEKADIFWSRLNQTRQTLDALNDSIKFKILKHLDQENRLDLKQAEELKNLVTLVPRMVQTLERNEKIKKQGQGLEEKREKNKTAPRTVKSSRRRRDVGEKDDYSEFIEDAEADTLSEDTMVDFEKNDSQYRKAKKLVKFFEEDRDNSVTSFEVHERNLDDTKVVYEEWHLSYSAARSTVRTSVGFMGIKFKSYDEDDDCWDIKPELRSQGELQSTFQNVTALMTESKYRTSIDKAIKAFPVPARDLINWLIEDRTESTNNEKYIRQWSVIAVRPKEKYVYRSSKKLIRSVKESDWLIMIKGETLGKVDRRCPDRWEDPWLISAPRKYYPRHYDRHNDREYERHRSHYEEFDDFIPPTPSRTIRHYARDEEENDPLDKTFVSGRINVGMFSSQEDAEKRMDKVLDDMAGKIPA